MQIAWTFTELMQLAHRSLSYAEHAAGDGHWEAASEHALKAVGLLEIITEVEEISIPDVMIEAEHRHSVELLETARQRYETYHQNGIRFIQRAANHDNR